MHTALKLGASVLGFLAVATLVAIAFLFARFHMGAREVEADWSNRNITSIAFDRTVSSVSITPLVNWDATDDRFATEPGVSLLIEADGSRILFDAGFNRDGDALSPLERNAKLLGVDLRDLDAVFLSHRHRDHMGGVQAERDGRMALAFVADGDHAPVISPAALPAEARPVTRVFQPTVIAPGVATTGPIARQLFMGRIDEQALIVNLEGRGLVVIVGCGHQTAEKLVERIEETFEEPIYAVVGDLHFPVPRGRLSLFGMDAQRLFASGDGPFDAVGWKDVHAFSDWAGVNGIRLVLGGHDTSDEVLDILANRFDASFTRLRVGERQCLGC